jgi:hypothetical protein
LLAQQIDQVASQDLASSFLAAWYHDQALSRDKCKIPPLRDKVSHLSSQVLDFAFYVATFIVCLSEKPKSAPINDSED